MFQFKDDGPPKERGRHRNKVEEGIIKRREREFRHQQMWEGAQNYYKRWDKVNTKFDEWTSPRYYQDNNKMLLDLKNKRDKEELLQKRRDKLKKLFDEEESSYQVEIMVKQNLDIRENPAKLKTDVAISTDVLKDVNIGLKLKEEEKKRREAELKLYHQWRVNNPIVRQFESKYRFKDLKLSWLDQQVEKRMEKENEEKENKRLIKEQEERVKREHEKELLMKREAEEKRVRLKEQLDKQIEELKEKQKMSEDIRKKEFLEVEYKKQLEELVETAREEEKRRLAKETALSNIKYHKQKLKQKALDVQEALVKDKELILNLKKLQLEDMLKDLKQKEEIKRGVNEFFEIIKQQQSLEKQRQKHMEFLFDSEARAVYDRQLAMWQNEEIARKRLLKDVLDFVNKQIEKNLQQQREAQKQILNEREEMLNKIDDCNKELEALKKWEEKKKVQCRKMIEEDIKLKNARIKEEENSRLKDIEDELQRVQKEEERLQKEIIDIQKKRGPYRPQSRRLFY
ncbi:trichoplein keratin filament-binding protein-like [Euwallacea fornicatus]|uniref:trichoplein keratin filament-binding protein-like n=1 Tax=Euwallacea fornicatus TaxID=995702 RepID=UPI00338D44B6